MKLLDYVPEGRREILVYVAGKLTDKDSEKEQAYIRKALETAKEVWRAGFTAICPHTNIEECGIGYSDYIKGDINIMRRCDCVLMLDNWEDSTGAKIEHTLAQRLFSKPIFYSLKELCNRF